MTAAPILCTGHHGRNEPRLPVVPGTELCTRCHNAFPRHLLAIASVWGDLSNGYRRPATQNDVGFVQTSGHSDVGDMWRPQVTQVLTDGADFAGYLGRLIHGFEDPELHASGITTDATWAERNPATAFMMIARYYSRPLLRRLEQGLPAHLLGDAFLLAGRAQKALDTPYQRRIPLRATCVQEVTAMNPDGTTYDTVCGGQLYGVITAPGSSRRSAVKCTHDPRAHDVPMSQLAALADSIDAIEQLAQAAHA